MHHYLRDVLCSFCLVLNLTVLCSVSGLRILQPPLAPSENNEISDGNTTTVSPENRCTNADVLERLNDLGSWKQILLGKYHHKDSTLNHSTANMSYVDRLELVNRVMVDVLLQAIPDQSSQGAVTVNESPLLAPRLEPGFRRSHKNVGPHKISQSFNSKKALALSKSLQKQIQKTIDKFKQNLIDRQTGKISKPAMNPSGKNTLSKIILPSVVNPGYQLENYKAVQSNINTGITVTEPSSLSSSSRLTEDTVHHLDRQKNNMEDKNAHPDFERNETNSGGNFSSSGADFILRLPIKPHQTRASVKIIFGLEAKNGTSVISCSSNGSTSDTSECSLSNSTTPWIPSFFKQLFDYFAQHLNSTGTLINMFCKSGNDSTDAADDETEPSTQIHERRAQISFDIVNSSNASKMEEERNENNTPHGKAAEETIVRDLREDNLGINQNNSGFSSNVQPLTSDLIYQEITARSAGTNHSSHAFVSNYSRESLPSSPELNASCPLEERWNKVEHLRRTIELLLLSVPVSLKEIMDASSYHYLEDFIFRPQGRAIFSFGSSCARCYMKDPRGRCREVLFCKNGRSVRRRIMG